MPVGSFEVGDGCLSPRLALIAALYPQTQQGQGLQAYSRVVDKMRVLGGAGRGQRFVPNVKPKSWCPPDCSRRAVLQDIGV